MSVSVSLRLVRTLFGPVEVAVEPMPVPPLLPRRLPPRALIDCCRCHVPILRRRKHCRTRCWTCKRVGGKGYAAYLFDPRFKVTRRERRYVCFYKYLRRVKSRFQARVWIGPGPGDDANLGLFESEWAAGQAVKLVAGLKIDGPVTALSLWEALRPHIGKGIIPETLLPKYVYRRPDGQYGSRVRKQGRRIALGPFEDPADAHRAMLAAIRQQ